MTKRLLQTAGKISTGVLTLVLLILAALIIAAHQRGFGFYTIESDSMMPVLAKGTAVVINKQDTEVAAGDVISYASPADQRLVVTHRVLSVHKPRGVLVTKGDNNTVQDAPVPIRNVIGTAAYKIPYAGYGLGALRSPIGLAIMVYLPAAAVIYAEVKRLRLYYSGLERRHFVLHGYRQA